MNNNFNHNEQADLFIFAGGRGLRINKITKFQQKCMIRINGKEPFINYQIKQFKKIHQINKIFILASYKASDLKKYYENDKDIVICVDKKRFGTYISLLNFIRKSKKDHILVSNGDTYVNFNFKNFFSKDQDIKILTKEIKSSKRYGAMRIKNDKLLSFKEKQKIKKTFINLGIALIKKNIIKNYSFKKFQSIEEELFSKTSEFNIRVHKTKCYFIDIGTYGSLKKSKNYFNV